MSSLSKSFPKDWAILEVQKLPLPMMGGQDHFRWRENLKTHLWEPVQENTADHRVQDGEVASPFQFLKKKKKKKGFVIFPKGYMFF
jgi:hypothetical protein